MDREIISREKSLIERQRVIWKDLYGKSDRKCMDIMIENGQNKMMKIR